MPGYDCGQCGGQCDECKAAEAEVAAAKRRNRVADTIVNIGLCLVFAGAIDCFITPKAGFTMLAIGAVTIIIGTAMHEIEHIVRDQV